MITAWAEHISSEERTVNRRQLVEHLAEQHDIHLCRDHLRLLLKKRYR